MEIYKNRIQIGTLPKRIKRKGHVYTHMTGLNLLQTHEGSEIQAVYRSLLSVSKHGGVTIIDLSLGKRTFSLYIYGRFPFFAISKNVPETFEDEL